MIHVWALEGSDPIAPLLQWGVLGIILVLILLGWLIPKGMYQQMKADRDDWRGTYEKERDAHQATRDALADASRSASAAVETARTTTGLLSRLGHQAGPESGS